MDGRSEIGISNPGNARVKWTTGIKIIHVLPTAKKLGIMEYLMN